ncbi:hypothetical protein AB0R05_08205, partial [Streptomyces niveus]
MATTADTDAMRRAVALAARALGATSPNPVVGCVILDAAGQPAGEGFHRRGGGPPARGGRRGGSRRMPRAAGWPSRPTR